MRFKKKIIEKELIRCVTRLLFISIILMVVTSCGSIKDIKQNRVLKKSTIAELNQIKKTKRILLFDELNGESINLVNNERGTVSSGTKFVQTNYSSYEKGFLSGNGTGKRCITYKGKGNFNPLQGTVELWVKVGGEFKNTKHNEHLVNLIVDNDNMIGLYYNCGENRLIYWIKDADTPGQNIHQKDLNTFMTSPKLDWHPGEFHHIAITWEKNHTLMYIDGKSVRWQSYRGQVYAKFNNNSRIEVARDSNFMIDAIRIWNYARAPRKLDKTPLLTDEKEHFKLNTNPIAGNDIGKNSLTAGCSQLNVNSKTGLPETLIDTNKHIQLIWGGSELLINNKKITFNGSIRLRANEITGSFKLVNEPGINMQTKYSKDNDSIKLEITLENSTSKKWEKDVAIAFNALAKDDMGFMSASGAPFSLVDGIINYAGTKQGNQVVGTQHPSAYLPFATVYQPKKDYGFTVTQPMNVPEYVTIDFGHDFPVDQLAMLNHNLTIKAGAKRTLIYYFLTHEGDWRAGLGFVRDEFPKTFTPIKKDYSKIDGGMVIGTRSYPSFVEDTKGTVWREISVENRDQVRFGNWVPDDPNAKTLALYKSLYAQIDDLHKVDILGLLYMQARECAKMDMAKERFSQSLQYDSKGNIITSYGFGAKMSCKEGTPWFNHLVSQSQKILKRIPNADGTFFDNAWDKEYAKVINVIAKKVHKKGLYFASNGGSSNCAGSLDAMMIEGGRDAVRGLAYLCLEKPVSYVPINHYNGYGFKGPAVGFIDNFEADLKECLLYGAYYGFNWAGTKGFSKECKKVYNAYLPLQDNLKGKKWYLAPHGLEVPENVKANIFKNGKGDLIIYITSDGSPFNGKKLKPFKVTIRVPKRVVKAAFIRRIEDNSEQPIPFKQVGDNVTIEVSNHRSITMLKIK